MSIFILVLYSVALALVMATAVLYAVWQKGLPETYRDVIYFLSGSRNRYYGAFLVIGSLDAVYSIVIYNSEMMSEELLPERVYSAGYVFPASEIILSICCIMLFCRNLQTAETDSWRRNLMRTLSVLCLIIFVFIMIRGAEYVWQMWGVLLLSGALLLEENMRYIRLLRSEEGQNTDPDIVKRRRRLCNGFSAISVLLVLRVLLRIMEDNGMGLLMIYLSNAAGLAILFINFHIVYNLIRGSMYEPRAAEDRGEMMRGNLDRMAEDCGLTPREKQIALLLCEGRNNAQIAEELDISESTVKTHIHNVLRKMNMASRTEVVVAVRDGKLGTSADNRIS